MRILGGGLKGIHKGRIGIGIRVVVVLKCVKGRVGADHVSVRRK